MAHRKPTLRERIIHIAFRVVRPVTLGVKALALRDGDSEILLVRHTYAPGWHLPGGGVEPGDSVIKTLHKELREECNLELTGAPEFFGLYHNTFATRRDHVVVYVCRSFVQTAPKRGDMEIAEAAFFPLASLPPDTTPATLERIEEVTARRAPAVMWHPEH